MEVLTQEADNRVSEVITHREHGCSHNAPHVTPRQSNGPLPDYQAKSR